jgi:hypothetical protein
VIVSKKTKEEGKVEVVERKSGAISFVSENELETTLLGEKG